ncbi:MAG: hypothetical protein IJU56_03810 [Clostridia bacterium]|nr:hypothetical protein [Clostridia bacterium]
MKKCNRVLSLLLCALLLASLALPALAAKKAPSPDPFENEETFGVAKGFVRTKALYRTGDSTLRITRSFDKQGKLLKETETESEYDMINSKITRCAYDKNGFLIKKTETRQTNRGEEEPVVVLFTNDKKGNAVKEEWRMGENSHSFKRTFDKKNRLTREIEYFNTGVSDTKITYDKAGNITKQRMRSDYEDNTWYQTDIVNTYDKNGNATGWTLKNRASDGSKRDVREQSVFNAKGQCTESTYRETYVTSDKSYRSVTQKVTTFTYDKKGQLTKETEKETADNGSVETTVSTYEYNENGMYSRTARMSLKGSDKSKSATAYTYDQKGRPTKVVTVYKDQRGATKTADAFAYDKHGNLTKNVTVRTGPGAAAEKTVRTYAYQKIGA